MPAKTSCLIDPDVLLPSLLGARREAPSEPPDRWEIEEDPEVFLALISANVSPGDSSLRGGRPAEASDAWAKCLRAEDESTESLLHRDPPLPS